VKITPGESDYGHGDQFMGVCMGDVFALAKSYAAMPRTLLRYAIEKLDRERRDHYRKLKDLE
jgi:hypothetical protein